MGKLPFSSGWAFQCPLPATPALVFHPSGPHLPRQSRAVQHSGPLLFVQERHRAWPLATQSPGPARQQRFGPQTWRGEQKESFRISLLLKSVQKPMCSGGIQLVSNLRLTSTTLISWHGIFAQARPGCHRGVTVFTLGSWVMGASAGAVLAPYHCLWAWKGCHSVSVAISMALPDPSQGSL